MFGERDFGSKEWETETGREVVCGERQPLGLARRSPAVQPNPRPSSVACSDGWIVAGPRFLELAKPELREDLSNNNPSSHSKQNCHSHK